MAPPPDPYQLVGRDLLDRFRVERVVAEGGFGVVYRATQLGLARPVAIKVLKAHGDPARTQAILASFRQEAVTIARLKHPAIVQVLDLGAAVMPSGDEAPFMVLEWIEGRPLESLQRKRRGGGGRAPSECVALMRDVFEAVDVAHKAGVAHRDLKPLNIMVRESPRGFSCSLLDFGIARVMEGSYEAPETGTTRTGSAGPSTFSPRYASPEQVAGARTGPWTDVHALGLIVVELLTDRAAYAAKDITSLCREVLDPHRPTPSAFGLDVGAWEPILARALAPHPADRQASAGELLDALVAALPDASHTRFSQCPPERDVPQPSPAAEQVPPTTSAPSVGAPPPTPTTRRSLLPFAVGMAALAVGAAALAFRGPSPPAAPAASSPPRPPLLRESARPLLRELALSPPRAAEVGAAVADAAPPIAGPRAAPDAAASLTPAARRRDAPRPRRVRPPASIDDLSVD